MSSSSKPAALTAAGIATVGPTPMIAGLTPTAAKVLHDQQKENYLFIRSNTTCFTLIYGASHERYEYRGRASQKLICLMSLLSQINPKKCSIIPKRGQLIKYMT